MPVIRSCFFNDTKEIPFKTPVELEFSPVKETETVSTTPQELRFGVSSLFNTYAVVAFPSKGISRNNQLLDTSETKFFPKTSEKFPSVYQLCNDIELNKKEPYGYSDFLYCKYIGKIPNNHLITLRRYPAPTFDNLAVPGRLVGEPKQYYDKDGRTKKKISIEPEQEFFLPIAQAVTWFGEETDNRLSDILSFSVNINWKNVESELNTVTGNEQGSEDSPQGTTGVAKFLGILTGAVETPMSTMNSQFDPYNNGPYAHRVYGPVNVITKTHKRDRGIDFKQSMTINFHYSLKSIGNINPKAAMLDLMSNMLTLTYNNAAFWGGANRYFPQRPTYPFLGGRDGMNAWYRGDPVGFAKSVGSQISKAKTNIMSVLGDLMQDPISTLKSMAMGVAKLGMAEMGKGRAPQIIAIKALLTGEPIGEWHMVVGNPYNPIAKIGNLIVTESKFSFNDVIGVDDFPTELTVSITVEHGRPRDKGDIESMFNRGEGRIYYPRKGELDKINMTVATRNSTNDTSYKGPVGDLGATVGGYATVSLFSGSPEEYDSILNTTKAAHKDVTKSARTAYETADMMFDRWASSQKK